MQLSNAFTQQDVVFLIECKEEDNSTVTDFLQHNIKFIYNDIVEIYNSSYMYYSPTTDEYTYTISQNKFTVI